MKLTNRQCTSVSHRERTYVFFGGYLDFTQCFCTPCFRYLTLKVQVVQSRATKTLEMNTHLIYCRYTTFSVHTQSILLPERTIAVEVGSEVFEEGCLHQVMKLGVEIVRDTLHGLKVA